MRTKDGSMSELKIRITKSDDFNRFLSPHVVKLLEGRLTTKPSESMLAGACEDIKFTLANACKTEFKYEKTPDGHVFTIDEADFERCKGAFTVMFMTNYEILR